MRGARDAVLRTAHTPQIPRYARDDTGAGFSLVEMVFALAIFSLLLLVVVSLENQMLRFDRSVRIKFMVHPEEMAVIARMRKDVLDAQGYPISAGPYSQTPKSLILSEISSENTLEEVVYDFATEGLVKRLTYQQNIKKEEWLGRGLPRFEVSSHSIQGGEVAVRLRGFDQKGRLIVEQIFFRRRED